MNIVQNNMEEIVYDAQTFREKVERHWDIP